MPAAVGMATEAIRAKYNEGAGGGGFGMADIEIGSKLDCAKVLIALNQIGDIYPHLSDWALFAYASPMWNSSSLSKRVTVHVIGDWLVECAFAESVPQEKVVNRMRCILPIVAAGVAIEQSAGASVRFELGEGFYEPVAKRSVIINALVSHDAADKGVSSETFAKKRRRYYQSNFTVIEKHIERIQHIIMRYDSLCRKLFRNALAKQNMSNYYVNS